MKKILIIISLISILILAGGLLSTSAQPDEEKTVMTDCFAYTYQFPNPLTDFTLYQAIL